MCRHLAYLGPAIPLSRLLFDPPHSLEHQSYAPNDTRQGGVVNADGFGVGWYSAPATATRYRRSAAIWTDPNLRELAAVTTSEAVLAAVRSATIGMPVMDEAAAPFSDGRRLFSFNGMIAGWPHSVVDFAKEIPTADLLRLDAPTDAAFLWALLSHRMRELSAPEAIARTVGDIAAAAPDSRLNLLYTDGRTVVGTTWWHSLWIRRSHRSTTLASEPLDDDPAWQPISDRRLVVADTSAATISTLPIGLETS